MKIRLPFLPGKPVVQPPALNSAASTSGHQTPTTAITRASATTDGTAARARNYAVSAAAAFDLGVPDSPYNYRDYQGPRNAVLQRLLDAEIGARDPKDVNICQHGKVFKWEIIFKLLGLNLGDAIYDGHDCMVFINAKDPMTRVTKRAAFFVRGNSGGHYRISAWLFEQYPELRPVIKHFRDASISDDGRCINFVNRPALNAWLDSHPEYRHGLLVFPRPSLWNRIGEQIHTTSCLNNNAYYSTLSDSISAGKEFFIEEIAALFVPELAKRYLPELQKMLNHVAGPHGTRISQEGVLRTVRDWIATQFPELLELLNNPEWSTDVDKLSERYGRTLGIIPIEWATGNMKQVMPTAGLTAIDSDLHSVFRLLRGQDAPSTRRFEFHLQDPDTGERRALRAGDDVRLLFKPKGLVYGDLSYQHQHEISGVVKAVIRNAQDEIVGIELRHWITDGWPFERMGTRIESRTYWLADCDIEDSFIVASANIPAAELTMNSYSFPEDSGEFMLPVGQSNQQAPISIGDILTLYTDPKLFHIVDAIVTGFERDEEGTLTGFSAYIGKYKFGHARGIICDADGTPIAIEHEIRNQGPDAGKGQTVLAGNFTQHIFAWQDINRMPGTSRFQAPLSRLEFVKHFILPQSPIRAPYDKSPFWGRSNATSFAVKQDSGDFMLRIGRPSHFFGDPEGKNIEQTPISPRDEVLLCVNTPGSFLSFRYDRVLVTSIDFDSSGRAIGLSGFNHGSSKIRSWLFKDVRLNDSYIETNPWFGDRANSIPGAYDKRTKFKGPRAKATDWSTFFHKFGFGSGAASEESDQGVYEDMFGYSSGKGITTPAWTERPTLYDDWLETNKLAKVHGMEIQWAYWVLQVAPDDSLEKITAGYRGLAKKFHPDLAGGEHTESMQIISEAWQILKRFHEA